MPRLRVARNRREKRLLAAEDDTAEEQERLRRQEELAHEIDLADVPRDPNGTADYGSLALLAQVCGRRRGRTIRSKVRTWQRFSRRLFATHGVRWPTRLGQVVE